MTFSKLNIIRNRVRVTFQTKIFLYWYCLKLNIAVIFPNTKNLLLSIDTFDEPKNVDGIFRFGFCHLQNKQPATACHRPQWNVTLILLTLVFLFSTAYSAFWNFVFDLFGKSNNILIGIQSFLEAE